MERFSVGVPWGIVRIESAYSAGSIPEIDPTETSVEGNDTCIVAAVVHPDISPVEIRVLDSGDAPQGISVYDEYIESSTLVVVVADLIGDDFSRRFHVSAERTRVSLFMDDPSEAQVLEVKFE